MSFRLFFLKVRLFNIFMEVDIMSDLYIRLDKEDAAVLLVDHQTGLMSGLVRDYGVDEFKNNILALADTAEFFDLPVILTTSFENGPNGPLMQELEEKFPEAPKISRPGQVNARDNDEIGRASCRERV